MIFLRHTYWVLLLAVCFTRIAFALDSFQIDSRNYTCNGNGNMICLGDAHIPFFPLSSGFYGLSLAHAEKAENNGESFASAGIAYYSKRIRMMEPSTRQAASFNTSFVFYETTQSNSSKAAWPGDGFTFVISADNSTLGAPNNALGIFDSEYKTAFKSIVVEFDNYPNKEPPINDIGWSHMSFDFMNITAAVARNASDVGVTFWNATPVTVYAWVEYDAETHQLGARISNNETRPLAAFLNYTVNLADFLEEYMWIGFSGANGGSYSIYYIGDWTFQSFGIAPGKPDAEKLPVSKSQAGVGTVVGYSVGAAVSIDLLLLIALGLFINRRRRSSGHSRFVRPMLWNMGRGSLKSCGHDTMLQLAARAEGYCFSYEELNAATRGFTEEAKLGQGGFGSVYRGVLHTPGSDFPIAVKKVTHESKEGEKEFMAEVSVISQLRHRNLLQLLGWCIDAGKYYIVYDLMPNGSLDKLLFAAGNDNHGVLSWPQRLNIARGIAAAVDYLHQGWKQQVIHRDIKASNIMLDENWNGRLGDFGLARLADHQQLPSTTNNIAGTYGYMAPEIIGSRRFTEKTDVFAFGAVALEIACGRRSIALHMESEGIILVDWVWHHLTVGDLSSVVDKRLGTYDKDEIEALLLVGLLCSHPDPSARPSMRYVVQVLLGDVPVPSVPTPKPVPMYTNLNGNAT